MTENDTSSTSEAISAGDRVYDKYQKRTWGEDPQELVVVAVHEDVQADEFTVEGTNESLHEMVDEWPVGTPDSYTPASDGVIEAVFHESLDRQFLGAWIGWSPEKLKRLCKRNGVVVYSYHQRRLTPTK